MKILLSSSKNELFSFVSVSRRAKVAVVLSGGENLCEEKGSEIQSNRSFAYESFPKALGRVC